MQLLQVRLKRRDSATKYLAKVLAIGQECDIAIMTGERGLCSTSEKLLSLTFYSFIGFMGLCRSIETPPLSCPDW